MNNEIRMSECVSLSSSSMPETADIHEAKDQNYEPEILSTNTSHIHHGTLSIKDDVEDKKANDEQGQEILHPNVNMESPGGNINVEDLEGRKLEIRLSRLPEPTEEKQKIELSSNLLSSSPNKTFPSTPVEKKSIPIVSLPNLPRHPFPFSKRKTLGMKPLKQPMKAKSASSSTAYQQVKIKINFLMKRKHEKSKEPVLVAKSKKEMDFEAKERDAVAEVKRLAESKAKAASISVRKTEVEIRPESGRSSASSSDDESFWNNGDEYYYRPMRAAAAAALEAVVHGKKKPELDIDQMKFIRGKQFLKQPPKGKSRRSIIFKRNMSLKGIQGFRWQPGFQTCRSLFYKDVYFQVGDIMFLERENETYFLQINLFMRDHRSRDLVELIWLTPNTQCPAWPFNPHMYDRRDDLPPCVTNMEEFGFVVHLPHDYYTTKSFEYFRQPYPGTISQRSGDPIILQSAFQLK